MEWFDIQKYLDNRYPFTIVIGGRGIGKSYSSLRYLYEEGCMPIYMRRVTPEMDACLEDYGNPYQQLNEDNGWNLIFSKKKGNYYLLDISNPEEPKHIGYGACLSTFSNLKGVNFNKTDVVLYDEFVAPPEKKRIKGEADAFFNFYETVNRNREFEGREPLKVILSSNSVSLQSPILEAWNLVTIIESMVNAGIKQKSIPDRGIRIVLPVMEEFYNAKKETALYRATSGTKFRDSALDNKFAYDSFANIGKRNLTEYVPMMSFDEIYIYKHKSRMEFYVTHSRADCEHYDSTSSELLFIRRWFKYKDLLLDGTFVYENYACKAKMINTIIK